MERFFIMVGAQKSGTTWLGRLLASHSQVFMPQQLEIHHFDTRYGLNDKSRLLCRARDRLRKELAAAEPGTYLNPERQLQRTRLAQVEALLKIDSDEDYRNFFRSHAGNCLVAGEKTPSYSFLPQKAFNEMACVFPNTHLLYIMRNPVDRMWSQYRFYNKNAAARPEEGRMIFRDPHRALASEGFRLKGDYSKTIRKMRRAAPQDRLFFGYYEHLTQALAPLQRLLGFLGLDALPESALAEWQGRRLNEGPAAAMPEDLRRVAARGLRPVYEFVFKELPGEPPTEWLNDYNAGLPD